MEWIRSDKPPQKHYQSIRFKYSDGIEDIGWWSDGSFYTFDAKSNCDTITHWKPLIEPPKEN